MKANPINAVEASTITLNLIAYIASNENLLERFLGLSGISLADLQIGAANPEFQAFVLDYALQDESLVIAFTSSCSMKPESLQCARFSLPGANCDS